MLIAPSVLQKAFPYLGHHVFSYQDWVGQNEEHLNELADFIGSVRKLYPNGSTENGLTYSDITAMPFYKASLSMVNATDSDNPLNVFAIFYPGAYFVTEEQAYNATQKAVWMLLNSYNIPDNDVSNLNDTQLGQVLYTYSERGGLLNYEPVLNDIHLKGSLKFRYNPNNADVVVIEKDNGLQLRRIIAKAGDKVEISEEGLKINGYLQKEANIYEETLPYVEGISFPIEVPENEYFVLGDSRSNAKDSRIYGTVKIEEIKGGVMTLIRRRGF